MRLILSEHSSKRQQNLISLFLGSKSFRTISHFQFHCEILTINLTAFVNEKKIKEEP